MGSLENPVFRTAARQGLHGCDAYDCSQGQLAPSLHLVVDVHEDVYLLERPAELVRFADAHLSTGGVGQVDDAQVMDADINSVVVEQPQEHELGQEVRLQLLSPLASQPSEDRVVAWVQVTTHADRVVVMQPGVPAGLGSLHQEDAIAIPQHQIGNDLLEGAIRLRLRARQIPACRSGSIQDLGDTIALHSQPGRDIAQQHVPRNSIDKFGAAVVFGHSRSGFASRRRAEAKRARSASESGPPSRSSSAIHSSSAARTSRRRTAMAAEFVAAMPAPIAESPRASRVMPAQPVAARASAASQSSCSYSRGPPATASASAAETMSGIWLMAATALSCATASIGTWIAPHASTNSPIRSPSQSRAYRPITVTQGRSTNKSGIAAP